MHSANLVLKYCCLIYCGQKCHSCQLIHANILLYTYVQTTIIYGPWLHANLMYGLHTCAPVLPNIILVHAYFKTVTHVLPKKDTNTTIFFLTISQQHTLASSTCSKQGQQNKKFHFVNIATDYVRPPLAAARIRWTLLLNGEERKRESAAGNQPHGDECLGFRVWVQCIFVTEIPSLLTTYTPVLHTLLSRPCSSIPVQKP
jgi:hypothetical protein